MAQSRLKRWKRYVRYAAKWVFTELPRGLDFTMRDKHIQIETGGRQQGYSRTDGAHARAIFEALNVNEKDKLLDIGCGKGAFLWDATKYPFGHIAGIDFDENLIRIAKKNFLRLGLEERVKVTCSDALAYPDYGDYNIFYFFNPFGREIMEPVLDKIMNAKKGNPFKIVMHNPVCGDAVEARGGYSPRSCMTR